MMKSRRCRIRDDSCMIFYWSSLVCQTDWRRSGVWLVFFSKSSHPEGDFEFGFTRGLSSKRFWAGINWMNLCIMKGMMMRRKRRVKVKKRERDGDLGGRLEFFRLAVWNWQRGCLSGYFPPAATNRILVGWMNTQLNRFPSCCLMFMLGRGCRWWSWRWWCSCFSSCCGDDDHDGDAWSLVNWC